MVAATVLVGFAVVGWAAGSACRRLLRRRRFGVVKFLLSMFVLQAFILIGAVLAYAVFTTGADEVPSDIERAIFKVGAWPVLLSVAVWRYTRPVAPKVLRRRVVRGPIEFPSPVPDARFPTLDSTTTPDSTGG